LQLEQSIQTSHSSSTAQLAYQAVIRWQHWPLSVAFASWRANSAEEVLERANEKRASTFLYYALTLKAITGFKWAVRDAHVDSAAGQHREVVTKRSVLRAWRVAALYVKVRPVVLNCMPVRRMWLLSRRDRLCVLNYLQLPRCTICLQSEACRTFKLQ
jgi:hypothetical protein